MGHGFGLRLLQGYDTVADARANADPDAGSDTSSNSDTDADSDARANAALHWRVDGVGRLR
jgi:hypothetical protein